MGREDTFANNLIRAIADEILLRGTENLGSIDFSLQAPMSAADNFSEGIDKTEPRMWSTTNTGVTAKSGHVKMDRKNHSAEVTWDTPWSYDLNFGRGPGEVPFTDIYEWAWKRQKEIARDYPGFDKVDYSGVPEYWRLWTQYVGGSVPTKSAKYTRKGGVQYIDTERRFRLLIFNFAFSCWRNIKARGVEPTFFASDAVNQTVHSFDRVVKAAVSKTKGARVVG